MTARRGPAFAVIGCALGGLLVLLTGGREWAHTSLSGVAGAGRSTLSVTGHQVAPSITAVGISLLALAAAILASNGVMRRVAGVLVVLVAGAAIGVAFTARGDVSSALRQREVGPTGFSVHATANGWWIVTAIGGVLALAAGVMTVFHSRRWSRMGEKYDAPSAPRPAKDPATVAWDALDRGEDPTT
jgi:uncharacterized membrane protein (TIGR02234 family)